MEKGSAVAMGDLLTKGGAAAAKCTWPSPATWCRRRYGTGGK